MTATPHPTRRPRGRPKKPPTTPLYFRIPEDVYDRYCRHAFSIGEDKVAKLIRRLVIASAPRA